MTKSSSGSFVAAHWAWQRLRLQIKSKPRIETQKNTVFVHDFDQQHHKTCPLSRETCFLSQETIFFSQETSVGHVSCDKKPLLVEHYCRNASRNTFGVTINLFPVARNVQDARFLKCSWWECYGHGSWQKTCVSCQAPTWLTLLSFLVAIKANKTSDETDAFPNWVGWGLWK